MVKCVFKRSELLLVSLIVSFTLINAKQLIRLRSGFECQERGYFRDAVNCKRFYYCPDWPRQESRLRDDELQLMREITEKGLECPDGSIFDETLGACQNIFLVEVVPPECKFPEGSHPHPESKNGLVPDILTNFH